MIVEHRGKRPIIDASAYIAPNAIISGDVTIGADARIMYGAVITAEGAPVHIGKGTVIMENAVVRGAGGRARKFPTTIGDYVFIGPTAHISGATLEYRAFIATGATILNGAIVERNAAVTMGSIVHIQTRVPADTVVPLQHIVIGDPCKVFSPSQAEEILDELMRRNFRGYVFDLQESEILAQRYSRSLGAHLKDKIIETASTATAEIAVTATRTTNRRKRS